MRLVVLTFSSTAAQALELIVGLRGLMYPGEGALGQGQVLAQQKEVED